jgi:splicing suppressor protein 51
MIRIRAKQQGQASSTHLQKCMDCQTTFFCSPRHFALIKKTHGVVPINGYGNLSQCQLNQQIREDVRFHNLLSDAKTSISPDAPTALADSAPLTWAPERVMDKWLSIKGSTWEGEFANYLDVPAGKAPFLRAASDGLALPMTTVYALEVLNGDWKPKDTLVIHVCRFRTSGILSY